MSFAYRRAGLWLAIVGFFLVAFHSATLSSSAELQDASAPCEAELKSYQFLLGKWTSQDGPRQIQKWFQGCAQMETWAAGTPEEATALRTFDQRSGRLFYTWVTAGIPPQIWEGRKEERTWRFYREWKLQEQPMVSRVSWVPLSPDRFEFIVEQSRDAGKTWRFHVRTIYTRE